MPRSLTLPCWMVLAALVAGLAAPSGAPVHGQVPARAKGIETLATAPDRFFTEGGVSIRYRDFGQGEPVVMIHGYTDRLEMWTGLADSLATTHRVIALDVRGFGLSSKPADPAAYGTPMADDVARLLGHLRIGRAHLVGYSMGAAIAGNLVARHPSRVATALLIGGPFFPDSAAAAKFFAPYIGALKRGEGLRPFFTWVFPAQSDSLIGAFDRTAMAEHDLGSLIAVLDALPRLAVTRAQGDARIPAIAIVGTGDPLLDHSRRIAEWWPAVRLVELPGADHLTVLDRPELLAQIRTLIGHSSAAVSRPAG